MSYIGNIAMVAVGLGCATVGFIGSVASLRVLVDLIKRGPQAATDAYEAGHSISAWLKGGPEYNPAVHDNLVQAGKGRPVLVGRHHPQFGTVMVERYVQH